MAPFFLAILLALLPACVLLNHPSLFLGKGAGKLVKKFGLPISFRLLDDNLVMLRYLVDPEERVRAQLRRSRDPLGTFYHTARFVRPTHIEEWWVENCTGNASNIPDLLFFWPNDCVNWMEPTGQSSFQIVNKNTPRSPIPPSERITTYQTLTFITDARGRVRFWHVRDPVAGEIYRPHSWGGRRLLKRLHEFENSIRDNPVEIGDDPEKVYRDLPTEMLEFFKPPPEVPPLKEDEEKADQ